MPYSVEWKDRMFIAKFTGELNAREFQECDAIHDGHPEFDNLLYSIWDFSQISSVNLSIDEVREIGAIDRASAISNPKITVLVVTQNLELENLVRLYQNEVADIPWRINMFKTIEEATSWITERRQRR